MTLKRLCLPMMVLAVMIYNVATAAVPPDADTIQAAVESWTTDPSNPSHDLKKNAAGQYYIDLSNNGNPQNYPLNCTNNCNFSIARKSGGDAQLVKVNDSASSDILSLRNIVIKALRPGVHGRIQFWAEFGPGPITNPTATPPVVVKFETHMIGGEFRRGAVNAAQGSEVWVTGYVQKDPSQHPLPDPPSGTFTSVGNEMNDSATSTAANEIAIDVPTPWLSVIFTDLTGQRVLMADFEFYLHQTNDRIELAGTGIEIVSTAIGGGRGQCTKEEKKKKSQACLR